MRFQRNPKHAAPGHAQGWLGPRVCLILKALPQKQGFPERIRVRSGKSGFSHLRNAMSKEKVAGLLK